VDDDVARKIRQALVQGLDVWHLAEYEAIQVGGCMLPVSQHVLNARLVSAISA